MDDQPGPGDGPFSLEDGYVPLTAFELAARLQQSAHFTGECICGGRVAFDHAEADGTNVYRLPHRRDCPVFLVFGVGQVKGREGTR